MRTVLAAALFLVACGGSKPQPVPPSNTAGNGGTTATTTSSTPQGGWWCFHVNGVDQGTPWSNSECVREQSHCQNDQGEMHGTNPTATFEDCKYVGTSECYTWTNGDGQPDILCFLNDQECNQSKALDLGQGTWTNISECHAVP